MINTDAFVMAFAAAMAFGAGLIASLLCTISLIWLEPGWFCLYVPAITSIVAYCIAERWLRK